jgi:hypothetical protein
MSSSKLNVLKFGVFVVLLGSVCAANAAPWGPVTLPPPHLALTAPWGPVTLPPPREAVTAPWGPVTLPPPHAA